MKFSFTGLAKCLCLVLRLGPDRLRVMFVCVCVCVCVFFFFLEVFFERVRARTDASTASHV